MKEDQFSPPPEKEHFLEDVPTEVRLIEAERAIERIEKLFSGDPLEKISRETGVQAATLKSEKKSFFLLRWWKSWVSSILSWEKLGSVELLLGVSVVSFGVGGLVGAMGFSFFHARSHREPVNVVSESAGLNESSDIDEASLGKEEPRDFSSKEESVVETRKPWAPAVSKSVSPKPAAVAATPPAVVSEPAAVKPVSTPLSPAGGSGDSISTPKPPASPKAAPPSNAAREQAMQEIGFANEVIGSLRSSASASAMAQADKAMARAQELMDSGKFVEAGKLARETAEQLLVGAP